MELHLLFVTPLAQAFGLLRIIPWAIAWLLIGYLLYFITKSQPIGKRELKSYFQSAIGYVCIIIFVLVVMSLTFLFGGLLERGEAELANSFFVFHPWVFIIIAPAVGMRLWSEEYRLGTIELITTYPIQAWKIILWKFLAATLVIYIALTLTFTIVITLNFLGIPDNGVIFSGYVGSLLLAMSCLAITSATSAITRSQVVSLLVGLIICLVLILSGFEPISVWLSGLGSVGSFLSWIPEISLLTHFESFTKGQINLGDLSFYVSFICIGLFLTALIVRVKRT